MRPFITVKLFCCVDMLRWTLNLLHNDWLGAYSTEHCTCIGEMTMLVSTGYETDYDIDAHVLRLYAADPRLSDRCSAYTVGMINPFRQPCNVPNAWSCRSHTAAASLSHPTRPCLFSCAQIAIQQCPQEHSGSRSRARPSQVYYLLTWAKRRLCKDLDQSRSSSGRVIFLSLAKCVNVILGNRFL